MSDYEVQEGPNKGNIAGIGDAQELAGVEDKLHVIEERQKREAETGLSDFERDMVAVMNSLRAADKYPDAFRVEHDKKGREVLIFGGSSECGGKYMKDTDLNNGINILTQYGAFGISPVIHNNKYFALDQVDLTRTLDVLEKYGLKENSVDPQKESLKIVDENKLPPNIEKDSASVKINLGITQASLASKRVQERLHLILKSNQESAKVKEKELQDEAKQRDIGLIIANI